MKPVEDFELLSMLFDYDSLSGRETLPFAVDPPYPRLADTGLHWFGEEMPHLALCYKRNVIDYMEIFGGRLRFQFQTRNGFIVMLSSPSWSMNFFSVYIYYILGGFRGADWGILQGREKESKLEWFKRRVLRRWNVLRFDAEEGAEPLTEYRIEDERRLAFRIHRHGWYRLILHDENPRRFLASNWRYEPIGSTLLDRRYFCVRKIHNAKT